MSRAAFVAAVLAAALALAGCGDSPEDEARDDGEQIGQAARALADARTAEEATAALQELGAAAQEVTDDTREAVREQLETQGASLRKAAEALGKGDQTAVQESVQNVRAQADAFRSGSDSVANEFWRGFEDGYDDA
jgi:hypothetical protein